MTTCIPQLLVDLVSGVEALQPVLVSIEAASAPDLAPLTLSLGELGSELVQRIAEVGESDAAQVFQRAEDVLCHGSEQEKNAVATGFLEGVVSEIDRLPERLWILGFAGPESRRYVTAWDRFNGIERSLPAPRAFAGEKGPA
jgi:hypothetical protein